MFALVRMLRRQPGFAGLLASTCAMGLAYSFVMPFLSLWGTKKIGMSPLFFGAFMTLNALSAMVVGTVLGRWSDTRFTRRTMLLLGGTGGVLGYTAYAFVDTPWLLPVIGVTLIALASISFSQLFAHVRECFVETVEAGLEPSFLTSVVRMSFSLAWTVGPAMGAWMMTVFGYRGVFLGAAALYLLFLLGIARFVPHRAHPPRARVVAAIPVWRVLLRADLFLVVAAFALVFAAHAINMMNLPLMVTQVLGAAPSDLGFIFAVGPIVELPLMLWFGKMAAHGRQLGLIRFGAAVTVAYFAALGVAQEPWHVLLAQILSGMSFAILTNVAIGFFQDLLPGQAGLATALFANASNAGNLLGYFSFGPVVGGFGNRGAFGVCAALTAVTLVLLLLYRPRTQPAAPEPAPPA